MEKREETSLETTLLPILKYIGLIGVVLLGLAYVVVIIIMILGFKADRDLTQTLLFAVINGLIGLLITQMFKIQGISFAKEIPENKILIKEFYNSKIKNKKFRNLKFYWFTSFSMDIITKLLMFSISTFGIIYIVIEGSKDFSLLWLAVVNLLFFVCFGLISLNKSYEFYNTEHISWIKNKIEESKVVENQKGAEGPRSNTCQLESKTPSTGSLD